MPEPPEGERDLQDLALQFAGAEGFVGVLLAEAAVGDRSQMAKRALERLAALRVLDHRRPLVAAYLAEHPMGSPTAVADLAGSLARRLDRAARTAADGVRDSYRRVTPGNLEELMESPITAAIDTSGNRWTLGAWAQMNCTTIGRHATSRGLAHRVGEGHTVTISTGRCSYCAQHAGEAVIGEAVLPPYHASCSCVAAAA